MNILEIIAISLVVLAALMSLYRLVFGPSNADRIVSTDALSLISTIVLVLMAMIFESSLYLDIALIYGILSFVGMIALAHVIESGVKNKSPKTLTKEGLE